MLCSHCSKKLLDDALYCMYCGKSAWLTCTSCARNVPITATFCPYCGQKFSENNETLTQRQSIFKADNDVAAETPRLLHVNEFNEAAKVASSSPRSPDKSIDRIVSNITYLSADIVSSTELISKEDVETARELLESTLKLMLEAVISYYGTILKTAGDGLEAYFIGEAFGLRACFSAAKMQQDCAATATSISIRVGLYNANVDISNKAEIENFPEAKLAQSIEQHAPAKGIQISETLYEEYQNYLFVGAVKNISIPGQLMLLPCYTLKNIAPEAQRLVNSAITLLKTTLNEQKEKQNLEIEGERKFVTSVFINLIGLKQENEKEITILKIVENTLQRFGGTLIKQMGEMVFAIFGAPVAYEDHALRACLASYLIEQNLLEERLAVDIRMGINSGEAVVDEIGGQEYHQYDALGSSVSLAARMMQTASNNQIQLSEETYCLVEKYTQVIPLGMKQVKGFEEGIKTYSLTGINRENIRRRMSSQYYANRHFIGRDKELAIFEKHWKNVELSHGQIMAVKAEPGVGKTRFLYECSQQAMEKGCMVYSVAASAYEVNVSYAMFKQFLQVLFSINSVNITAFQLTQLKGRLKKVSFSEPLAETGLTSMLGGSVDEPKWTGLTPILQQKIVFQSAWEVLKHLNVSSSLIVIFEDLQWCDNESLQFIEFIAMQIASQPILMMLDYRPEFTLSPVIEGLTREVRLSSLKNKDSLTLVQLLLPGNEDLQSLYNVILESTMGNPLFIEEYVKSVIEQGGVKATETGYQLTKTLNLKNLPKTIQGIIGGRIDRLIDKEKKLLQQASILGMTFLLKLLRYVSQLQQADLELVLQSLERQGFIIQKALIPEPEYSFVHAHIREVTYNSMLLKTKIAYHAHLVEEIEQNEVNNLARYYWTLAQHSYFARLWEKALSYYKNLLPLVASIEFPPQQSVNLLPNVQHCFNQMSDERRKACFNIYGGIITIILHRLFIILADTNRTGELIHESIALAIKYGNLPFKAIFQGWQFVYGFLTGKTQESYKMIPEVFQSLEEAKKQLSADEIRELSLALYTWSFHAIYPLGYFEEFDQVIEKINTLCQGFPFDHASIYTGVPCESVATIHYFWCNSLRARLAVLEKRLPYLESLVNSLPETEPYVIIYFCKAIFYFTKGNLILAIENLNKAIRIAKNMQHRFFIQLTSIYAAEFFYYQGEKEKALVEVNRCVQGFEVTNYSFIPIFGYFVPEVLANLGKYELAQDVVNKILNIAEREQLKPLMAGCYCVKAKIYNLMATDNKHDNEIESLLEKAQQITDEIHCNLQNPMIQLVYADYYLRLGQIDKQKEHHQRALEYFKEYEMDGWYDYYKNNKSD